MGLNANGHEQKWITMPRFFIYAKKSYAFSHFRSEIKKGGTRVHFFKNNLQYTPNLAIIYFTIKQKLFSPKISDSHKRGEILLTLMSSIYS